MKKRRVSKKIGLRACSIIMSAILTAGTVPEAAMTVLAAEGSDIVSEEDGEIISCDGSDVSLEDYSDAEEDEIVEQSESEVVAAEDAVDDCVESEIDSVEADNDIEWTIVTDMSVFKRLMTQNGDVNIRLKSDLYEEVPYYRAEYDSDIATIDPWYREHWDDNNTEPVPYWLTVGRGTKRLDLNGYNVVADYSNWHEDSTMFKLDSGTTFILNDKDNKGKLFYDGSTPHLYTYIGGYWDLFVDTFEVHNQQRDIFEVNGANLIVNGGKVAAGRASAESYRDIFVTSGVYVDVQKYVNGTAIELNSGNVTINGGEFYGRGYSHVNQICKYGTGDFRNPDGSYMYTVDEMYEMLISQGKLKAEWNNMYDRNAVIEAYSGNLNIIEGEFNGYASADVFQIDDPFYDKEPNRTNVSILAGKFTLDKYDYDARGIHYGGDTHSYAQTTFGELGFTPDNLVCGKEGVWLGIDMTGGVATRIRYKDLTIKDESKTKNDAMWALFTGEMDGLPDFGRTLLISPNSHSEKPVVEFINRSSDDVRNPKKSGDMLVQTKVDPVFDTTAKTTGREHKMVYTYEVWDFDGNKLGTCGTALGDSKIDLATAISGLSSKLKENESYIIMITVKEKYEGTRSYEVTSANSALFAVSSAEPITITKQPAKQLIAKSLGEKVILTAQAENAASSYWVKTSPSYESYKDSTKIEGDGENTLYVIPRGTSKYACIFTNSRGSMASNEVETCYQPSFDFDPNDSEDVYLYQGKTAYIRAYCNASGCKHCGGYIWTKEGNEISKNNSHYTIIEDSAGTTLQINGVTAADEGIYYAKCSCDHADRGEIFSGDFYVHVKMGNWDSVIKSVKLYGFNDLYLHGDPPKKDSIYCDDPRVSVKKLEWTNLETNKLVKADTGFKLTLEIDSSTTDFEFDDLVDWTLNDDPNLSFQGIASDDHKQVEIAWTFGGNTPIKEQKDTITFPCASFDIMQGAEDVFVLTDYEWNCPDTHFNKHTVINVEADPAHPMPEGLIIGPLGNTIEGTASAPVGEYDVTLKFYIGISDTLITDVVDIPITINIIGKPQIKPYSLIKKDLPLPHTEHEFGDYKSDGADTHSHTCTFEGCGYVETESHNWDDGTVVKEATTTQEGSIQYTCITCGETKTEVIPKEKEEVVPEHEHKLNLIAAKEATCLETGNKEFYICYGCLKAYSDAEGKNEISDKSTLIIPAFGHDWDKWETITPATETTAGREKRVCKRDASHTEERVIPAGNHVHNLKKIARTEATKTEPGNIEYYICEECGRLYLDAAGRKDTTESEVIIPAGTVKETGMLVYFGDSEGLSYNSGTSHYEMTYTGGRLTPEVIVEAGGNVLTEGVDYTVKYANNTAVSAKASTATITGKGDYSGGTSLEFYIVPACIDDGAGNLTSDFAISGLIAEEGKKFAPVVSYMGKALTAKDITITGSTPSLKFASTDASPTISITGKGNFTGEIKDIPVTVKAKAAVTAVTIKVTAQKGLSRVYDGSPQMLKVSTESEPGEITVTDPTGKVLTEDTDFIISYGDNVDAGKVNYTVTGCGDYTGSAKGTFTITPDKDKATVTAALEDPDAEIEYKKSGVTPAVIVTAVRDGAPLTLREGVDYKIKYSNNKKAGATGKYTVTFIGNYKGRKPLAAGTFTISAAHIKSAKVYVPDMIYNKKGKYAPAPYVELNGELLNKSDYTVEYFDGDVNITGKPVELTEDSKKITVKVTGKGNYASEMASGTFNIIKANNTRFDLSKAKITAAGSAKGLAAQDYTGLPVCPAIDVYVKSGSMVKVNPSYYNVTYIGNTARGKAVVMVTGTGTAIGSKTATFTIKAKDMKSFKEKKR